MKRCKKCGKEIPYSIIIDGMRRPMQNRSNCIDCVPYGKSRYVTKTEEGRLKRIATKTRRYYYNVKMRVGSDPVKIRRQKYRSSVIKLISGGCQICSYNRCFRNIVFHHLRDKQFQLDERHFQYAFKTILNEIRKCMIVCHNCHGEIHAGLFSTEKLNELNNILKQKLVGLDKLNWESFLGT